MATDQAGDEIVVPFTEAYLLDPPRPLGLKGEARLKRLDAAGRRWATTVTITGGLPNTVHTFGIVTGPDPFLDTICRFTTSPSGAGGCRGSLNLDDYHVQDRRTFETVSLGWAGPQPGYASGRFPDR